MKNKVTIILLLLYPFTDVLSQDIAGKSYQFISGISSNESSQFNTSRVKEEIVKGSRVKVLYTEGDTVYYEYWDVKKFEGKPESQSNTYKTFIKDTPIFHMEKTQFLEMTAPLYNHYKGAKIMSYTIPFRLRGLSGNDALNRYDKSIPFDFESSLSLQANGVFGFGGRIREDSFLDCSVGIGVTGISLDRSNTNASPVLQSGRTATAFTTSFGAMIHPSNQLNIGLFLGWDFLGRNDEPVKWTYNGRGWLGAGINIALGDGSTTPKQPVNGKQSKNF